MICMVKKRGEKTTEQRKWYPFGMTPGWVNDDTIFVFGWTVFLSASCNHHGPSTCEETMTKIDKFKRMDPVDAVDAIASELNVNFFSHR